MARSSDRRRFKRFSVDDGALAILKPDPIRMGRVVDISTDGLGIEYFNESEWPEKQSTVSVRTHSNPSGLEDLPVRTVEDKETAEHLLLEKSEKRCCSMQFCQLTDKQQLQLDEFIRSLVSPRSVCP